MPRPPEDIQTIRVPLLAESTARGTSSSKDQRYVNAYFDVLKNSVTKKENYFFCKRPGYSLQSNPTGTTGAARGMRVWRGFVYSCYGNKLYKGTTDLGVTLSTSTGRVYFEYTRNTATNKYLAVSDGVSLYVIDTSDGVTVLNNVVVSSSSVANPTTITTATAHGLTTGNKVVIRGHTGSTPSINGTVYTVTVTGATTFTIPVNVTVAGTGGSLGVFPTPNVGQLIYFDGYLFTQKTDGSICNCDLDDPYLWDPTKFITPIQDNGSPVGIGRQGNYVFALGDHWVQGFYDNANATGSPLMNYEQAMLQVGCASKNTIVQDEAYLIWLGASNLGGYTIYRLQGVAGLKDIGDPAVNRVLNAEPDIATNASGFLLRTCGHVFYVLTLSSQSRTFVYDVDLEVWYEWTGTDGNKWPILMGENLSGGTIVQHMTDGKIYNLSPAYGQDNSVSFPVFGRTIRFDFDTNNRKFLRSVELIGDQQATSTPVSVWYYDDDYITASTPRTFDMVDSRPMGVNFGSFRRRAWVVSYTGANPLRLEGLQFKFRLGTD